MGFGIVTLISGGRQGSQQIGRTLIGGIMKHGCFAAIPLMIVFSAGTTWAAQSGTISVVVASFGLSCGANARGNYTDLVKSACDGQTNCSFGDIGARGDPYPGWFRQTAPMRFHRSWKGSATANGLSTTKQSAYARTVGGSRSR